MKSLNFDGKLDVCATGFPTPQPLEHRACHASEEVRSALLSYPLVG